MQQDDDIQEEELNASTPEVYEKYRTCGEITNRVLAKVVQAAVPGAKIIDLCVLGDKSIEEGTAAVYNKSKFERGVAFPTCVSVNNCAGHFSPLTGDNTVLQEGDLVKVDLGAHIDGFITQGAHSFVCTANKDQPATGRHADVICAAYFAAQAALRLFKAGKTNQEITATIQKVADEFKVQPLEGVLSHQTKRFVVDGNNVVINKETIDQKVEDVTFEDWDAYTFDIVMSTGEGKARETEARTTIFKRAVDQRYTLKLKASRAVFTEINTRFPTMPFTLRALKDEKTARLGITECLKHDLVEPYPVLYEKPGELVAQIKFTAIITPSGTVRMTTHPEPLVRSDFKITDAGVKSILASGVKKGAAAKKKKKRSKKAAAGGVPAAAAAVEAGAGGAPAAAAEKKEESA